MNYFHEQCRGFEIKEVILTTHVGKHLLYIETSALNRLKITLFPEEVYKAGLESDQVQRPCFMDRHSLVPKRLLI
jgi:hypothetical protein